MPDDKNASPDDKAAQGAAGADDANAGDGDGDAAAIAAADNPDAVKNAIRRHQDAARAERERADAAEAKAKEYEDRDKSEQQKLEERASEAEKSAGEATQKLLRYEVAAAKGVPLELADRLRGEDKKAMEADADDLLKLVKAEAATPDLDGGARTTASDPNDMDARIRAARR